MIKQGKNLFFKVLPILFLILFQTASVFGEDIKIIKIATPQWEGQTNEDGTGLFFEIVRSIYEPVGIKMEFNFVPWKRAEYMIESGKADAILDTYRENISRKMIIPKYPMVKEYNVAVFKKDKIKKWEDVKSLDGLRLLWIRGYDFHKNPLMKDMNLKWEEIDDYETAWKMLNMDRTDAYLDAFTDVLNFIRKNKVDMTPYRMEFIFGENGYVAFSKSEKSEKLIAIYDKRIIELFKSGELKNIFKKWDYPFPADIWSKEE